MAPLIALWLAALLSASPAVANTRLVIAEGVSVLVPPGFQRTVTRPPGATGVTLFEVRDGADAFVVVVYRAERAQRAQKGRAAPSAEQALELHTAELAERLGEGTQKRREVAGLSLFGARRPTHHLNQAERERLAWVVAAELPGADRGDGPVITVVCSALHLPGSPNASAFTRMAETLMSAR